MPSDDWPVVATQYVFHGRLDGGREGGKEGRKDNWWVDEQMDGQTVMTLDLRYLALA